MTRLVGLSVLALGLAVPAAAADIIVAVSGGDFTNVNDALQVARGGDRVLIREKPGGWIGGRVLVGGTSAAEPLEIMSFPGERAILLPRMPGEAHLAVNSFTIVRDLKFVGSTLESSGSGIRTTGADFGVTITNCSFEGSFGGGRAAVEIPVNGGWTSDLVVRDCVFRGLDSRPVAAIRLQERCRAFSFEGNLFEDLACDGISIANITLNNDDTPASRRRIANNVFRRLRATDSNERAAALRLLRSDQFLVEGNVVTDCDEGMWFGADDIAGNLEGLTVRSNVIAGCTGAGLVVGGMLDVGTAVRDGEILHNLLWRNRAVPGSSDEIGDLWLRRAPGTVVCGNVVVARADSATPLASESAFSGGELEANLWFAEGSVPGVTWNGFDYTEFATFQAVTGRAPDALLADPLLNDPLGPDGILGTDDDDFRPSAGSPCIDAGRARPLPDLGETDALGVDRFIDDPAVSDRFASPLAPQPDLGPFERDPGAGAIRRYCGTQLGLTAAGRMTFDGSASLSAADLVLVARRLPSTTSGVFATGTERAVLPAGDGILCIGGSLQRLGVVSSDTSGAASLAVDLGALAVVPGERRSFQLWFRDAGGPAGFDLTDALEIEAAP
ncbi:MAG: right-handed parallel beta-helix repeat-containing protein [Planctomycetota bacterium]